MTGAAMSFKQALENNPFVSLALTGIAAFAMGWGSHVAVIQQSNYESVLRGTYVLKEDIEAGVSKLYVTRQQMAQAVLEASQAAKLAAQTPPAAQTSLASRELADATAALAACKAAVRTENAAMAKKLQSAEAALSAAQQKKCPDVILDNFYTHNEIGRFDAAICLSDATEAASRLGSTAKRVDNSIQITQGLGTPDGSFCAVACYPGLVSVTCNGLNKRVSVGLTAQIRNYLSLR